MNRTTLEVRPDEPIGTISPRLYGWFAEHLGRSCYGGLWVGRDCQDIPHTGGFRNDVLAALRGLPVPMIRWPGGCYADHYHWQDGIGPSTERPRRLGMSCDLQVEDDNGLGTHEFMQLCSMLGAEPYLAGNVGTGTPQELCDWLEYCNSRQRTTLTERRASNGAREPFNVRLWGVGNETWGCGGNYDPVTYAHEYRRYATMLRHVDRRAELVVVGHHDDWNTKLLEALADHPYLIDHLSIHPYFFRGGAEVGFSVDDYYALLAEVCEIEETIRRTAAIIDSVFGGRQQIGIAVDEWGVWHPEVRDFGPGAAQGRRPVTYEQASTLRDALTSALVLAAFHRQCNRVSLANQAHIVNLLQAPVMTEGNRMWCTPNYHVMRLHTPHIGAIAVPIEHTTGDSLPNGTPAVSATASRATASLAVTVVNAHFDRPARVHLRGCTSSRTASAQIVAAESAEAMNTADDPNHVQAKPLEVHPDGTDGWSVELPPHAVATLMFA